MTKAAEKAHAAEEKAAEKAHAAEEKAAEQAHAAAEQEHQAMALHEQEHHEQAASDDAKLKEARELLLRHFASPDLVNALEAFIRAVK